MTRPLRFAVLAVLVCVSAGLLSAYAQEDPAAGGAEDYRTFFFSRWAQEGPPAGGPEDYRTFFFSKWAQENDGREGVLRYFPGWADDSGEAVSRRIRIDGLDITADAISYDAGTGVVEAEGNVTVTATREDGSTVTMRAERMTVEQ